MEGAGQLTLLTRACAPPKVPEEGHDCDRLSCTRMEPGELPGELASSAGGAQHRKRGSWLVPLIAECPVVKDTGGRVGCKAVC